MSEILIDVPQEYEGERIDKFLSVLVEDASRNSIQKLIESEKVLVNGQPDHTVGQAVAFRIRCPGLFDVIGITGSKTPHIGNTVGHRVRKRLAIRKRNRIGIYVFLSIGFLNGYNPISVLAILADNNSQIGYSAV